MTSHINIIEHRKEPNHMTLEIQVLTCTCTHMWQSEMYYSYRYICVEPYSACMGLYWPKN